VLPQTPLLLPQIGPFSVAVEEGFNDPEVEVVLLLLLCSLAL
jgi:hypothetical protein